MTSSRYSSLIIAATTVYLAAFLYSVIKQYYFYQAVVAFLVISPLFCVLIARDARRTLLGTLVLSFSVNASAAILESNNYAFPVEIAIYLSDISLLLCYTYIFITKTSRKDRSMKPTGKGGNFLLLLFLWFMICLLSSAYAIDRAAAAFEVFAYLRVLLVFIAVYWMIDKRGDLQFISIVFVCACALQALLIPLQYFLDDQILRLPGGSRELDIEIGIFRPSGTLGHSSNYAKYAALVLPMSLTLFQYSSRLARKYFFGIVTVIIFISLMLTLSRIGILTGVLALSLVIMQSLKTLQGRRMFITTSLVCLGAFATAWYARGDVLLERVSDDGGSAATRIPMILTALEVIRHNLMGVGINNYINEAVSYDTYGVVEAFPFPVHNIFLLYYAEIGILGGSVFLWLLYAGIRLALLGSRNAEGAADAAVLRSIGIGLFCSWLQGLVGWGHRSSIIHLACFAVLTGLASAYLTQGSTRTEEEPLEL